MKRKIAFLLLIAVVSACCLALCACNVQIKMDVGTLLEKCDGKIQLDNAVDGAKISVEADVYALCFCVGETDVLTVDYVQNENFSVSAKVTQQNQTFQVEIVEKHKTLSAIGFTDLYLVVSIPQGWTNCQVEIDAETSFVQLDGLTLDKLDVTTTTGRVLICDCYSAKEVEVNVTTGSVRIDDLQAPSLVACATTGSVNVKGDFIESVTIKTTTGSVSAKCQTKNFFVSVDTGSVNFTVSAEKITVSADTGSVRGRVKGDENLYAIEAHTGTGRNNLKNKQGDGTHSLTVNTDTGYVHVTFEK